MIDFRNIARNSRMVFFAISAFQLFYLLVLCVPNVAHIITFACLWILSFSFLMFASAYAKNTQVAEFSSPVFVASWFIALISIILTSRLSYIENTILSSLGSTRNNPSLGQGSIFSIVNAAFYPLGLIAVFYRNSKTKLLLIGGTLAVCLVDIIFLGTRNGPFFIVLFYLIFLLKYSIKRTLKTTALLTPILVFLIVSFEYTTRIRSGFQGTSDEYWLSKILISEVSGSSELNVPLLYWLDQHLQAALPLVFLAIYVSHSIPDFFVFISN